jgi:hypothetical protein
MELMARDYKKEYANYQGKPEQIARRSQRNTARRTLEKEGLVTKGDGNDVNHRVAIVNGGQNNRGNLQVQSKGKNRSFKRNKNGGMA